MALIDVKNNRKSYLKGVSYTPEMRAKINIVKNQTLTYNVNHDFDDMVIVYAILVNGIVTGDVRLQQYVMTPDDLQDLHYTINNINIAMYNHLYDKFDEIDACTTETAVNAVVWEFDIEQNFPLQDYVASPMGPVYITNIVDFPYIPGESQVRNWVTEMFEERGL